MEQTPSTNVNPVLNVNKNGYVLYSNEAGNTLLNEWGIKVGENLPSSIGDLVQRVISRNSPEKIEVKIGNRICLVVFSPFPEQECVNVSGFDISDQKELEEKLRESEEKYRAIFENSIDAILLTTPDGTIQEANPAACHMFMMNEEEIIQAGRDAIIDASDPRLKSFLEKRARIGNSSEEINHRRKDGTIFPGEVSSAFFRDKNGIIRTAMIIRDITERKRTEEEIKGVSNMLQLIMNNIPQGIFWKDRNSRYMGCNKVFAKAAGVESLENIVGKTDYDLPWSCEQIKWFREYDRKVMESDTPEYHIVEPMQQVDGELAWVETNKIPLQDTEGNVIGILGTYEDITERKRAEEALKKAHEGLEEKVKERTAELEEAYKTLVENERRLSEAQKMAHIGIWDWNLVTDEMYWSDEVHRIFGYISQESVSSYKEILSRTHPDDRDYVDNEVKRALKGKPFDIDHRIVLANGEERIVHAQGEVLFDEKDSPVRMRGTAKDVTESKKAEEKIQILADSVESSNDAIITRSLDDIIIGWNKGAEKIHGYSADEVLGKHISMLEPDSHRGETTRFSEMIKQGKTIQQYETSRLRKDGTIITVSLTLSPVISASGELLAISAIARDVTESKKAEEKLRESEEKYRNIVETANEGIYLVNDEDKLTYANKKVEELSGYTLKEIIGRPIWDFISKESIPIAKMNFEKRRQGIDLSYELKLLRKDGSSRWGFVSSKPFLNKEGKFSGYLGMLTDITERKEAEEALARSEKARKKEIHHRIKNNFQVISSLLDLQAEKFDDKKVVEAFKESQNRVISMALIHEELYKGEDTDTLNFSEYLQELIKNLFSIYSLDSKNIYLCMDLEENTFFNMDIAVPLGIIVNELISNSLKHAFPDRNNGKIHIKLRRDESKENKTEGKSNSFTLTVSDNGIGIPGNLDIEDLDNLGLQLVTTLVDQLDGELELKRDKGTEFVIRFAVSYQDSKQIVDMSN